MSFLSDVIKRIEQLDETGLELTDEEIDALSESDIEHLVGQYGSTVLMKLPPRELGFFEWVRREDPDVWNDLWDDDTEMLVALSFLRDLCDGGRGFQICELVNTPNYYFTPEHIKPDGTEQAPAILNRAEKGRELSVGEGLLFEILKGPMDIWHFCYRFGLPVEAGKSAVARLAELNWIVHLTAREDLIRYIEP